MPTTASSSRPCLVNPCRNGASCIIEFNRDMRCVCQTGYTGIFCNYPGSLLREIEMKYILYCSFYFEDIQARSDCGTSDSCLIPGTC